MDLFMCSLSEMPVIVYLFCWRRLILQLHLQSLHSSMFTDRCVGVTDKMCWNMSSSVPEIVAVFMCQILYSAFRGKCQYIGIMLQARMLDFASGFVRKVYFSVLLCKS